VVTTPTHDPQLILDLVRAAVLAPSSHNTQPWLFGLGDGELEVHADRRRGLAVNDPDDRELTISCGAALFNARVAAAHRGLGTTVVLLPDEEDDDLLATLHLTNTPVAIELAELHDQLTARHTYRGPLQGELEEIALIVAQLHEAAAMDGAALSVFNGAAREHVAELVAEGDRRQFADRHWRRELASWMHPRRSGDGLTVASLALPMARAVVGAVDLGDSTGEKDHRLADEAPVLAVLSTDGDTTGDWLRAGQALEHLLLRAAASGWQAGYLNQPCQVGALRPQLRDLVPAERWPQVVLRLGRPTEERVPAPRRPLEEVLL
jgi:nitroreductase